jgi:hypothetical protein
MNVHGSCGFHGFCGCLFFRAPFQPPKRPPKTAKTAPSPPPVQPSGSRRWVSSGDEAVSASSSAFPFLLPGLVKQTFVPARAAPRCGRLLFFISRRESADEALLPEVQAAGSAPSAFLVGLFFACVGEGPCPSRLPYAQPSGPSCLPRADSRGAKPNDALPLCLRRGSAGLYAPRPPHPLQSYNLFLSFRALARLGGEESACPRLAQPSGPCHWDSLPAPFCR